VRASAAVAAIVRKGGTMPEFPGITHIPLTVTDLRRSVPWYGRLFDKDPVLDELTTFSASTTHL
jgi:hypothetical protein